MAVEVGRLAGAVRVNVADAAVQVLPAVVAIPTAVVIPVPVIAAIVVPVIVPPIASLRMGRESECGRGQGESEKQ